MNWLSQPCLIHFQSTRFDNDAILVSCAVGDTIQTLREADQYFVHVTGSTILNLYIDDEEVGICKRSGKFLWKAGFFAGRVEVVAIDASGTSYTFYANVCPVDTKLSTDDFNQMVQEIRDFDGSLLLGESAATERFGYGLAITQFDSLIALARLKKYGPEFLDLMEQISRSPHQQLKLTNKRLPLSSIRRLSPSALVDRRLLAMINAPSGSDANDSIELSTQIAVVSFDTPANRTLKALLFRFNASCRLLLRLVEERNLTNDKDAQELRFLRRTNLLKAFVNRSERLIRLGVFRSVKKAETTAAGLTHIAAQPLYSRCHRIGISALRRGIDAHLQKEHLNVSHSWGVYETWCYINVLKKLKKMFSINSWRRDAAPAISSDISVEAQLIDGKKLSVHFQARFPSIGNRGSHKAWSISKERIPDIVLVIRSTTSEQFLVLDAKYRSGRQNILDAMESAHIYRDSLRLGEHRPEFALLLHPGRADVPEITEGSYWLTHRVGAQPLMCASKEVNSDVFNVINLWIHGADISAENKSEVVA